MLDLNTLLGLWLFIFVMVGTPGPANLLTMAAGARFGIIKCISFNLGLTAGKVILNIAMGLGLGVALVNYSGVQIFLKFFGAGFMIYLAFKSWNNSSQPDSKKVTMGWKQGIFVHPLNPKAWVMTIIAWTEFGPQIGNFLSQIIIITSSFAVFQIVLHTTWSGLGALLSRALPNSLLLNRILIFITVAVVVWAVLI